MRRFDVESQRSVLQIKEVTLLPLIEYPKSRELFHDLAEHVERRVAVPGEDVSGLGILGAGGAAARSTRLCADARSGGRLG